MQNRTLCRMTSALVSAALVSAVLAVGIGGCAAEPKDQAIAKPEPVAGWDGVKNVSRADRFTFAGQPTESALEKFSGEGGTLVIDLRTHQGADAAVFDEQARVEALGMKYAHLPITAASFSRADVDRFAQLAGATKGQILVHCASSNRVGGLWAAYLAITQGVYSQEAIAQGKAAGLHSAEAESATLRVISP